MMEYFGFSPMQPSDECVHVDQHQAIRVDLWPLLPEPVFVYYPEADLSEVRETPKARRAVFWLVVGTMAYDYFFPERPAVEPAEADPVMLTHYETAALPDDALRGCWSRTTWPPCSMRWRERCRPARACSIRTKRARIERRLARKKFRTLVLLR